MLVACLSLSLINSSSYIEDPSLPLPHLPVFQRKGDSLSYQTECTVRIASVGIIRPRYDVVSEVDLTNFMCRNHCCSSVQRHCLFPKDFESLRPVLVSSLDSGIFPEKIHNICRCICVCSLTGRSIHPNTTRTENTRQSSPRAPSSCPSVDLEFLALKFQPIVHILASSLGSHRSCEEPSITSLVLHPNNSPCEHVSNVWPDTFGNNSQQFCNSHIVDWPQELCIGHNDPSEALVRHSLEILPIPLGRHRQAIVSNGDRQRLRSYHRWASSVGQTPSATVAPGKHLSAMSPTTSILYHRHWPEEVRIGQMRLIERWMEWPVGTPFGCHG